MSAIFATLSQAYAAPIASPRTFDCYSVKLSTCNNDEPTCQQQCNAHPECDWCRGMQGHPGCDYYTPDPQPWAACTKKEKLTDPPLFPTGLTLKGFAWPDQNAHIVPVTYTANFSSAAPAIVNATVGDALECGELCRHSFGRGNTPGPMVPGQGSETKVALFRMEDLFPAKGKLVERKLDDGTLLGEWAVNAYLYGVERVSMYGKPIAGCDYAAVAVEGSVESEPYFACVDISDATKPVGVAKLTKLAPFPTSRPEASQAGGEYSIVSSGPFSSHVQTSDGVYHVLLQSRGIDYQTAEGSHSLIASVNMSSGAVKTVQHTVAEADWDKDVPKGSHLWRWPVVAIAGGLNLELDVLMARRGGVEAGPQSVALGRRYGLYWAKQPLERASGLVNATAKLTTTFEVPDHKAGVPDAPDWRRSASRGT